MFQCPLTCPSQNSIIAMFIMNMHDSPHSLNVFSSGYDEH